MQASLCSHLITALSCVVYNDYAILEGKDTKNFGKKYSLSKKSAKKGEII
jgi:hypothetical protein